ncbi:hypothetical protein EC2872000_5019 [Escherichia coli 2872000]|nr:hypothetical protein EC2872000_5019 [Escherichia coli 2872000]
MLIVLAALDEKRPGHVLTRDIERVLERSGEAPVYGPNLRAPNLQLAVELTDAGRAVAHPLLLAEQDRLRAEQRTAEVVVLPLIPLSVPPAEGTSAKDLPVGWAAYVSGLPWGFCGTSRRQHMSAVME